MACQLMAAQAAVGQKKEDPLSRPFIESTNVTTFAGPTFSHVLHTLRLRPPFSTVSPTSLVRSHGFTLELAARLVSFGA